MDKEIAIKYVGDDETHYKFVDLYTADHKRAKKLSKRTLESIERYTSNGRDSSGEFNHILINNVIEQFVLGTYKFPFHPEGLEKDAYLINKALKGSFRTPAEFLYKGIKRDRELFILQDKKIGDEFSFNNFVSTSYSDASARTHAEKNVILQINRGFGIPAENPDELEFLLPAQSRFRVVNKRAETWIDGYDQQNILVIEVVTK